MKYLIILLLVWACNETVTDPSVSQLSGDVTTLKLEVKKLTALQSKYASQEDITLTQNEIAQMNSSIELINKLLTAIQANVNAISLPDTVNQYIGNGNLIYHETFKMDTVNIVINDSVSFKIWKTGSEIITK